MDRRELWVKCDCVENDPSTEGPFNCEVNVARLRHVKTTRQHDEHCPLFRLKKSKDADNTVTEGKASPLNPVGGNDWLQFSEEIGILSHATEEWGRWRVSRI